MKIPENMTEAETTEIINKVLHTLAARFQFGYFSKKDMFQEGWIFALDGLERYDNERPLENFLRVHIRNRFINFKRKHYTRCELPCRICPFYDPKNKQSDNQCTEFENKLECTKYKNWEKTNESKRGLMNLKDIDLVGEDSIGVNLADALHDSEIMLRIERELPANMRADFLKMLDNVSIPRKKRLLVQEKLIELGIIEQLMDVINNV